VNNPVVILTVFIKYNYKLREAFVKFLIEF